MDAIVGVWLSSVVGAVAFCGAGYLLGQQTKPAPEPEKKPKRKRLPEDPPSSPRLLPPAAVVTTVKTPDPAISIKPEPPPSSERPNQHNAITTPPADPSDDEPRPSTKNTAFPPAPRPPSFVDKEDEENVDRPTVVPNMATQDAILQSAAATIPPPRAPSMPLPRMGSGNFDLEGHEATRQMIRDALTQVEQAAEQTRVLQLEKQDLQRMLDLKSKELKDEIVLRAAAEASSLELSDRLAKASEETASLRHRVNTLDRQAKLLRESLKGTGAVEDRRRDIEEAEAMRVKLRDVVSKLERASNPPPSVGGGAPVSQGSNRITMPPGSESAPRSIPGAPNVPRSLQPATEDNTILREEINRLAQENRALRAQTLGSLPPKTKTRRGSAPDIDLDRYRTVMERLGSVAGLKGAVLADEVGSLLIGTGELAESLAAFGAYIRDAGSRTDRLLPLDGVEEVDIRDRAGVLLSTRVVMHDPMELSLVFLASADPSFVAAKKIIEESLRL